MADQIPAIQAYLAANPYKAPQAAPKKPAGNFLTHLLPTIGGTGGAVGGAAIGTALLPGVGTLAGALLGGALGGGGAKVGENALEHKKLTSGVAGQAIEQGVLGAGPLKLAKAGAVGTKAALGVAAGKQGLEDALLQTNTKIATPTVKNGVKNLITQGQQAQGRVAGVSAGTKIAGKELTPQDTKKMLDTLKAEGIQPGNANNAYRDLQDKLNQYGKQINTHFTSSNIPLATKELNGYKKEFIQGLKTSDPTINKQANILATDLKNNVTDTKSLWQFRKQLDTMIPDAKQGADNTGAAKLIALKNMRQFITGKLGDVPGASNYHALSEIKPFVSAEAKRLNNPGGGIVGRIASSGPVQKAESLIGRGTEKAGTTLQNAATNPYSLGQVSARTVPLGLGQAAAGQASSNVMNSQNANMPNSDQNINANIPGLSQTSSNLSSTDQSQQQQVSPYTQEALMYDLQRDPKNSAKYIDYYQSLEKIFTPAAGKGLNSTQQQQATNAQSGLDSLSQIAQTLQQNPNASKLADLPGGSLVSNLTGTGSYKAALANATDVIGRLRSGGAINADEEKRFRSLLPAAFDDQQTVNYKLNQLSTLFQGFVNPGGNATNSTDLVNALMQSGYSQ